MGAPDVSSRRSYATDVGRYFEGLGLSPTAGRVIGWLLTQGVDGVSPSELCAALGVAKSSISVALQRLELLGLVVRIRPYGTQRDRFTLGTDVFGGAFRAKMVEFERFQELAERGLDLVGDSPEAQERLTTMRDMYGFMARRFPALLTEWESLR